MRQTLANTRDFVKSGLHPCAGALRSPSLRRRSLDPFAMAAPPPQQIPPPASSWATSPAQRGRLRAVLPAVQRLWRLRGPQALAAVLALACAGVQIAPQFEALRLAVTGLTEHGAEAISRLADLAAFPHMVIGVGLVLMAAGLLLSARVAWALSLLLGILSAGLELWATRRPDATFVLASLLIVELLVYSRHFVRSSLAASSLFALLGIGSMLLYGVLGSLWFGAGYNPPIHSLPTAFYYAIETMSTVGYGDIVPRSVQARMFTVSMIVVGISVFATTLSVVIGPLVGGSLRRALEGRMQPGKRKDHYVIIGVSSLAYAMWKELHGRGVPVTVIVTAGHPSPYPESADVIVGDATRDEILDQAGVAQAKAVLTLRDDDAENAFAVLAVKEHAPGVRTIAGVNDPRHLNKIRRVQPDLLFAPQLLGSEILARDLFGEPIDNDTVHKLLFARD